MEKKKILRAIIGHCINILWSLAWSGVCAACLYFFVPLVWDISHEILQDLCAAFALVVFITVWLLNYTDTKKFINRF